MVYCGNFVCVGRCGVVGREDCGYFDGCVFCVGC